MALVAAHLAAQAANVQNKCLAAQAELRSDCFPDLCPMASVRRGVIVATAAIAVDRTSICACFLSLECMGLRGSRRGYLSN